MKQDSNWVNGDKLSPRKILFVVNVDWFFLSHRLPIALAAQAAGYEVHLACRFSEKGTAVKQHGFVLHELRLERSGTSLFKELKTIFAIKALVKKVKPDLIHSVTIKPVLYSGLATRFSGIARVASISGLGFVFISEGFKANIVRKLVSFFYKLALRCDSTKVIFQNPTDKALFINEGIIRPEQAVMIKGSGVDLNKYKVVEQPVGEPVVMLLARLLVDKGVVEFVDAARLLKSQNISCRMVLVGDIDENPKSVSIAQLDSWVNDGLIEYWGFSDNVSESYAKSNIVVLPSYREGLPKSLIEAAACGRAVITTDVPGCRDAITPNQTGLLVPVKDAVALAEAIAKLCVDDDLRKQLGAAGRLLAQTDFDINSVVNKHLSLYQQLTENKSAQQ